MYDNEKPVEVTPDELKKIIFIQKIGRGYIIRRYYQKMKDEKEYRLIRTYKNYLYD